jgi:hypothetical protein
MRLPEEYPIAPTLCDELSHAQDNAGCGPLLDEPFRMRALVARHFPFPTVPIATRVSRVIACLQELTPGNDYCLAPPVRWNNTRLYGNASATSD